MANFVNINNTAPEFTVPLPFQHFTGDYANATLIRQPTGVTNVDICHSECKNEPMCEFFTFVKATNTCNIYSANSTDTMVTGVRIETSLRNIGMSNIYSNYVPSTTRIQAPTNQASVDLCETSCSTLPTCNVYTYDFGSQSCTFYGTSVAQGNTGVAGTFTCSASNKTTVTLPNIERAKGISITNNGEFLIVTHQSGTTANIFVRNGTNSYNTTPITTIQNLNDPRFVVSSMNGEYIVITNYIGGTANVYRKSGISSFNTVPIFTAGLLFYPVCACITPNGNFFAVTNMVGNTANIYQLNQAGTTYSLKQTIGGLRTPMGISMSSDGTYMVVANAENGNTPTGTTANVYRLNSSGSSYELNTTIGSLNSPFDVSISPDMNYFAISSFTGNTANVYVCPFS